ncbi:galactose mutarotase [Synechococcus sp. CS-602]|uniref:aldose epimerase family protein n=1 Tax=Synechococcaceae TaxID=1890426 RepID=UPI0008FF1741|nr:MULTISPECIES: galactose mutarotase [Synechococcaceae]MCT4365154.1 galactose mutarotase [Candidatus Regnicoccus frigidus MAG-AL1]APD47999.1 galactose mutarotase [Synechococcus sp. SynAce01]MCT0203129.1 galactose mutarotase [Synechococcus sp. CS-603]MCT0204765.1 galactose mutarotase [Synechococcus sp. CS-602]MCT0246186.1 galactose mutarotase [Synechococcus sp. CS-601]
MPLLQRDTPYPHWQYEDPLSGDLLRVVPERGGLLSGWRCSGHELLYLDQARFAEPALSVRGGIPVLFPICGNLPGDRLPLPQGDFELKQHGFARDLPWQLAPLEPAGGKGGGVELSLTDTAATLAAFPFRFHLQLAYRLEAAALAIKVRIENCGDEPMPYSFGLHPYFNVSGLQAPGLATAEAAGEEAASGNALRLEGLPEHCFNHLTMAEEATAPQLQRLAVGVDLLAAPAGAVRLLDPAAGLALELQPTPPFDLAVIWTEPPRSMLCLEPWTAPRGALVSGDRRLVVPAGGVQRLQCRYALRLL